jgi:hypothetical protein
MAASFLARAAEEGITIIRADRITRETSRSILDILTTPTEFDEFKYPIQFTLPKDSLDCIFVASDDPLIYTKVISCVETRKDSVVVVGSENWLDQSAVDYEKYQTLGVVLAGPTFTARENRWYQAFQQKFSKSHGRTSSNSPYTNYAKIGYEFMLFVGHSLKKHGVYFQEALKKERAPGFLMEGYDYQQGRDNQLVPFIRFESGTLVVVQK